MGEPVEVVEGPDSEISRLFPKCRPRFTLPSTAFVSEINNTNIIQGTAVTSTAADINKNCVSDANDNYQVFPATLEDVTPHRDDSSGCDSSRMSVDSACATTSSTPASHSSSSSSSHTSFATHNYPADEKSNDLNGGGTLNANDDLSVVSAYNDDRFSSTVLDSSFEEANGSTRVMSSPPTIGSSHKRSVVHSVSHNMGNLQNDSHISPQQQQQTQQPQQPHQPQQQQPQQQQQQQQPPPTLSLLKREHFRLRDSRIETAGGKEMFSQSRSRPSRKRHEEGRRGIHHASHHFNHNNNSNNNNHHQPLIHHSHHHHHQHAIPQQKHQPGHKQQQSNEYIRKVERSSSRSNSTNSNSSSSSNERGSSESKSEGKEPPDEESEEVSPSRVVSEDVSENVSSTLVYETRLSGSSEVVFDDISEWVERGLSVRGVENSSLRRPRRGSNNDPQQPFVGTSITPPTPLSRSERDSEYDDEDEDEDDDEEDDDDDDSPMRVTRIGSVPIAEYEGSPRRYGQPIRPPRPGFPRRVNNISQDERTRVLINSLEGDKKSAEVLSRNEKSHSSYRHEFRKSKHKSNLYQHEKGESDSPKSSSTQERNNSLNPLGSKENSEKKDTEKDETQNTLDFSQDNNSPVKISISTITSSYASSLPNKAITSSEISSEKNNSNAFEDYRFEDSETRKVLDEFFLESRSKPQEFYDLEYTLKRQHGNSYVGQRLAATECEEEADQPQTEDSYVLQEEIGNPSNEISEKLPSEESVSDVSHANQCPRQDVTSTDKKNITGNDSENSQKNIIQENGNSPQDNCEIGVSRNFTLSPETTSCDSLDVESEFSVGDAEGSIPSSGKIVNTMPVLEDGLSSGDESEIEINTDQRLFSSEEHQAVLMRQQLFLDQHLQTYQSGSLHIYPENKNGEMEECSLERERAYQRTRSLDNQLCRGELPPLASSMPASINHHGTYPTPLPISSLSPLSPSNAPSSPFSGNSAPHATSSPHSKHTHGKPSNLVAPPPAPPPPHSTQSTLAAHSPSSSTLTLMKKQISEIEREIALKKPEGGRKHGEGDCSLAPKLDLHLLDPLNKKVGEPPPPPAPHPHRGSNNNNNSNIENGSPNSSTPPHTSSNSTSPSKVIGHLHSPQYTPVSVPVVAPQLLSSLGTLTSPGQVSPHMVPGHPATLEMQHKSGNGVSPSRESVEAAIADIKQAIRRTKNLPLKTHPQEKQDRGPVWIPRNNRRDLPYTKRHSSPPAPQTQENSSQIHQQDSSPSGGSNKSQERSLHEDEDGDTDQETDRLLGQQRSDEGYLDEKNWGRVRSKPPTIPLSMAPNHKDVETEDKDYGKKKGRSKEVMVHEPAVLIEGVLFRARYLGSTQLVSEGQPTKTTRMMQAEEAVSRIKDADEDRKKSVKNLKLRPTTPPSSLLPQNPIPSLTGTASYFQSPLSPDFVVAEDADLNQGSADPLPVYEAETDGSEISFRPNNVKTEDADKSSFFDTSSDSKTFLEDCFQEPVKQMSPLSGKVTPPIEERLKTVLDILDRRLDEELNSYDDGNNISSISNEAEEAEEDEVDISPETKSIYDDQSEKQERCLPCESVDDENIYVNVSNLSYEEEQSDICSTKGDAVEYLDVGLNRSYTYIDRLDRRMEEVEEEDEEEEEEVTESNQLMKSGSKQGNMAWIVDAKGGIGARGNVFHIRFIGSMEVDEDPIGDVGIKRDKRPRKEMVMEAVARLKAPEGEVQPSTEVDLFISTEKIMVLNTDLKEIMMDHALRTISYIADIGDLVVLMARRRVLPTDDQTDNPSQRIPKMICHVFESDEAQFIAQSIGQAFQVAYLEFLKANGIEDHSFVKEMDYQEVLNSQEIFGDELQMFAKKELQKEVVVPKMKGEILGVVVVESGWGSMVPTVVIANLSPTGAAAKCGQLNIGDQIIAINGISLVGLPLSNCQNYIKNTKYNTAVKLTVVPCPPVVEVKIRRPDTKYQLGFSVQNGVICSLLRGGIAERGGVRVGHRIIDINSQSVVAVPHEKIVNLLATSVGEIRMKTMPTSIFRLLTGQETPQYI